MKKIISLILTILMVGLFSIFALGSGEDETSVSKSDSTGSSQQGEKNDKTTVKVGETLTANKLKIKYVSCEDYNDDNKYFGPKDGNKFIKLTLEAENTGDSDAMISYFDFECYADGTAADGHYEDDSISATLSSGRKAKGAVYFEVPKNAKSIEVEYETNFWSDKKAIFVVK